MVLLKDSLQAIIPIKEAAEKKEELSIFSKRIDKVTVLEQLAYVANRGMGALEYKPTLSVPKNTTINIDEIVEVLKVVMDKKKSTKAEELNNTSLVNIFKMGSSAGGAQPKILLSEHKKKCQVSSTSFNSLLLIGGFSKYSS